MVDGLARDGERRGGSGEGGLASLRFWEIRQFATCLGKAPRPCPREGPARPGEGSDEKGAFVNGPRIGDFAANELDAAHRAA